VRNFSFSGNLSKKKLLLIGFLFAILLVIPLTVYLVQQQQETRSRADANTTMSLSPPTQTATQGAQVTFDVFISPGNNQVNFVKLVLKYDPTKLSATEESFELDPSSQLSVLQGPIVGTDDVSVTLGVGSDPTRVIQENTKLGRITFTAEEPTDAVPTEILFDSAQIQIRSVNGSNNDAFNENVFLSGEPASVTILSGDEPTVTPEPTEEPEPTVTVTPTATPTASPTDDPGTGGGNQAPVCDNLEATASSSTVTFTLTGTDADGTISKATFDYGDGSIEDINTGGGLGTASVSISQPHTYQTSGTFNASATLTDDDSGVSNACNFVVTVSGTGEGEPTPIPATGPGETIIGLGAIGGILFLIGAFVFFAL
jgi:hypothetical protein